MARLARKLLPALIAAALAAGLAVQMHALASTDNVEPFHAAVREARDEIPSQVGPWEGTEVRLPQAAGTLLHPNATFARRYWNRTTGRWATLILVHCRDSRDMSGHYPPNCYPGSGWTQLGAPAVETFDVWGTTAPMARYEFTRTDLERTINWTVYDMFILPTAGMCTEMRRVQRAGGDYRSRPYGAAQIQVVMDRSIPEDERAAMVREMLTLLEPVVSRLQLKGAPR